MAAMAQACTPRNCMLACLVICCIMVVMSMVCNCRQRSTWCSSASACHGARFRFPNMGAC
jgi:hypothetical protein